MHSLQVQCNFSPPQSQPQFPGVPCPVCLVSLLDSLYLAATLPADVNHPESQEVFGKIWKPICSLVGDAISGAEFAPFWFRLGPASPLPPASSGGWAGLEPASSSQELLSPSFVL